ncbi:MAG: HlyD family efflux transporter periplasmic adaptor subunit [Candidatus Margulisiibacteriota bacterium]
MKNRVLIVIIVAMALVGAGLIIKGKGSKKQNQPTFTEIKPARRDIHVFVSSTGVVQPQNRVEVKPPVSGRIEAILVKEGDWVKASQTVGLMSSTERAALLDAARIKGGESYRYWENVYKPIALIAPISGEVILQKAESGQTVGQGDVIMALSDRLIVQAQVDETDIGKVKQGQRVVVRLDAYPNEPVGGSITHISYESTVVNNVTVYNVEITLPKIPAFFRSGMSANTEILVRSKSKVLSIPVGALQEDARQKFVLIKDVKPSRRQVKTGISNETYVEILEGLTLEDTVLIKDQKYTLGNKNKPGSPLMMRRSGGGGSRGSGR